MFLKYKGKYMQYYFKLDKLQIKIDVFKSHKKLTLQI